MDDNSEDFDEEIETEFVFDGALRCAAHTLQLVVKDGLQQVADDVHIKTALQKVKRLASFSARSTNFAYAASGHVPPKACPTRWNSDFGLLKHVVEHADILTTASSQTKKPVVLNQTDLVVCKKSQTS